MRGSVFRGAALDGFSDRCFARPRHVSDNASDMALQRVQADLGISFGIRRREHFERKRRKAPVRKSAHRGLSRRVILYINVFSVFSVVSLAFRNSVAVFLICGITCLCGPLGLLRRIVAKDQRHVRVFDVGKYRVARLRLRDLLFHFIQNLKSAQKIYYL